MISQKLINGRATPGELSLDAKALIDRLLLVEPNDTIEWGDLDKVIGRNVRVHSSALGRARIVLRREHRIEFEAVPTIGIKRLDSFGCVAKAHSSLGANVRRAKRTIRVLACADYQKLDGPARALHDTVASLSAVALHVSGTAQIKQFLAIVSNGPLTLGYSLRALIE